MTTPQPVAARLALINERYDVDQNARQRLERVAALLEQCAHAVAHVVIDDNSGNYDIGQLIRAADSFNDVKTYVERSLTLPRYDVDVEARHMA